MIVTLDVFSGRPNPSWLLTDADARQLVDRFASRATAAEDATDGALGFRGFVVSGVGDDAPAGTGLPSSFRVGAVAPADYVAPETQGAPLALEETDEAVRWLLSTGRGVVSDVVAGVVLDTLDMRRQGIDQMSTDLLQPDSFSEDALVAPCQIRNTAYNPGFWNQPAVQPRNNCYNYAMNHRTDTFAQPGRFSGHMYTAINCANVGAAASWDGCKPTCTGSAKTVALVIWPNTDYHWYRRHSEGFWGHKPGQTAARNTDNLNRVINGTTLTPANCNRGPYTVFCGYRFSPTGMRVR